MSTVAFRVRHTLIWWNFLLILRIRKVKDIHFRIISIRLRIIFIIIVVIFIIVKHFIHRPAAVLGGCVTRCT